MAGRCLGPTRDARAGTVRPVVDDRPGSGVVCPCAWPIAAGAVWIIVVGSGSMADSDSVAVWVVDDSGHHQVLDEFVSTRDALDRQIEEVVAVCAYRHRWTMDVIRINGGPLRLVGVAVQTC